MHVLDHDHLVDIAQHALLLREKTRNDAGDLAAVRLHGARKFAHEAEPAAAVHQADPGFGHHAAERVGGLGIGRINVDIRATVDADIPDRAELGKAGLIRSLLHLSLVDWPSGGLP